MSPTVEALVRELALLPHPEGGFYRETYRADQRDAAGRAVATMIYFLLPHGHVSRLHRIDADEGWHAYLGGPLEIYELDDREPENSPIVTRLGTAFARGERPQHLVEAGRWFGAAPAPGTEFSLVGCTVAPAFDFARFELGDRERLQRTFPRAISIATSSLVPVAGKTTCSTPRSSTRFCPGARPLRYACTTISAPERRVWSETESMSPTIRSGL